jgi:hypothetical protein
MRNRSKRFDGGWTSLRKYVLVNLDNHAKIFANVTDKSSSIPPIIGVRNSIQTLHTD